LPETFGFIGDPGRIRTCDLQLRRLLLYPLSYGAESSTPSAFLAFLPENLPCNYPAEAAG
jgi:hypothetical protein